MSYGNLKLIKFGDFSVCTRLIIADLVTFAQSDNRHYDFNYTMSEMLYSYQYDTTHLLKVVCKLHYNASYMIVEITSKIAILYK